MKNNYSIAERNRIVEEHLWCIDRVIRKNRSLMRAARLDYVRGVPAPACGGEDWPA